MIWGFPLQSGNNIKARRVHSPRRHASFSSSARLRSTPRRVAGKSAIVSDRPVAGNGPRDLIRPVGLRHELIEIGDAPRELCAMAKRISGSLSPFLSAVEAIVSASFDCRQSRLHRIHKARRKVKFSLIRPTFGCSPSFSIETP